MIEAEGQLIEDLKIVREPLSVQCTPEGTELALRERVKELNCLYKMGEVVDKCGNSSQSIC